MVSPAKSPVSQLCCQQWHNYNASGRAEEQPLAVVYWQYITAPRALVLNKYYIAGKAYLGTEWFSNH